MPWDLNLQCTLVEWMPWDLRLQCMLSAGRPGDLGRQCTSVEAMDTRTDLPNFFFALLILLPVSNTAESGYM